MHYGAMTWACEERADPKHRARVRCTVVWRGHFSPPSPAGVSRPPMLKSIRACRVECLQSSVDPDDGK